MNLIIMRHAKRVRHGDPDTDRLTDMYSPLHQVGWDEASQSARALSDRHLRPGLYLTSWWLHARQTAERMRDDLGGDPVAPVAELSILTPYCDLEVDLAGIVDESRRRHRELSDLETVVIITHQPRVGRLIGQITRQDSANFAAIGYAQGVLITADSLDALLRGQINSISPFP